MLLQCLRLRRFLTPAQKPSTNTNGGLRKFKALAKAVQEVRFPKCPS